ncbi:hypothetical protein RHS02_06166, partial [Rhizoctonia solani]
MMRVLSRYCRRPRVRTEWKLTAPPPGPGTFSWWINFDDDRFLRSEPPAPALPAATAEINRIQNTELSNPGYQFESHIKASIEPPVPPGTSSARVGLLQTFTSDR